MFKDFWRGITLFFDLVIPLFSMTITLINAALPDNEYINSFTCINQVLKKPSFAVTRVASKNWRRRKKLKSRRGTVGLAYSLAVFEMQ